MKHLIFAVLLLIGLSGCNNWLDQEFSDPQIVKNNGHTYTISYEGLGDNCFVIHRKDCPCRKEN